MKVLFISRPFIRAALSLLWLLGVFYGFRQVQRYNNAPGQAAAAPLSWPHNVALNRALGGATLVMAVHPHCPCTRASLANLAQLMARSQGQLSAVVVFLHYPGVSDSWMQTETWRQAQAIPGVQVVTDTNGVIARRFGALTSGQTCLYDAAGRLRFSGGLTAERGHEGDSGGYRAALALVRGQTPAQTRTPVFGCPLFAGTPTAEKDCFQR